jgi:phosphinothricin acetyltransferase
MPHDRVMRTSSETSVVRHAEPADAGRLNEIYNHYVLTSAISFALTPTTEAERFDWLADHPPRGPHRVVVAEDRDRVVGFAASSRYRAREAYATSIETSVYVAAGWTGRGIGSSLYEFLFASLVEEDLHRAYAGITMPNPVSVALHGRFGFEHVGTFGEQGRKFDRYWDVAWFEKAL